MKQKFFKVKEENGKVHFEKTRYLTPVSFEPNKYVFKDTSGKVVEPSELELDLYNEVQTSGIKINNGWITFLGIVTILNLIGLIILISKIASLSKSFSSY